MKENGTIGNIVVKTIGQCRGQEFPVLLTIRDSSDFVDGFALTTLDFGINVAPGINLAPLLLKFVTSRF